ncbi:hypothetical protein GH714_044141 [Hevea brasiliensis]|uniref:Uncharacterized protein n=1 Tax=Hevea brasiliensis TaxID=3981 RepID=A0A6A6K0V7_HEVBR|nr:hypothetical protein GH714_044141 [Hevea brasiliensis]
MNTLLRLSLRGAAMKFQLYQATDNRDGKPMLWLHDKENHRVALFCPKWAPSRIKQYTKRPDSITWEMRPSWSRNPTRARLTSPSAAKKWLACPAALACEFGIPNESGAAAVNGTAMHALAEARLHLMLRNMDRQLTLEGYKDGWVLNEGKGPITFDSKVAKQNGKAVKITDDFVSQVGKYVNYCRPIIDAAELVEIEYRVNLTRVLHPGVEVNGSPLSTFGTADLVALMPASRQLHADCRRPEDRASQGAG